MPFSRLDRKVALVKLSISNADIAEAVGVDQSLVSHVLAGRKRDGDKAQQIIRHIASLIGAPAEEVFPGSERRAGGEDRRRVS